MEKTKDPKPKKEKKPKEPKPKKEKVVVSEEELVKKYANRVIKNQVYHGRVDQNKFQGLEHDRSVSKNLWLDTDFFFSVVFQSSDQKYIFLEALAEKFNLDIGEEGGIQIVNGLILAKALNIELKLETTKPYPAGNIDLMPFVLDEETI